MTLLKPLRRALLGLALPAFALFACQTGEAPVIPISNPDSPTVTVNGVNLVNVTPSQRGLFIADNGTTAERVSAKDGATIANSDATLTVVPGSIPDDTTITMKAENDGYVSFKFGPNGLQFDPSAVLTISADKANLDGIDTDDLAIAGAFDDADDWQVIGGTYDPVTNTVSVEIDHFSRYGLCIR